MARLIVIAIAAAGALSMPSVARAAPGNACDTAVTAPARDKAAAGADKAVRPVTPPKNVTSRRYILM
ncbi:MAG: hypothetical protein ABS87_10440 [Sphingomonas sp. SCN 67-18]|uniref:hypothetical protein n=1 Tax=uncultured Sphingomonas sp. TaxID=158754 RepID=UPI00086EE460|nr:hypothetical protein [Sphingomonas sp. SCN 67-18]ODU20457.1 MAG: hypothetical protein ABS87_10440 [Sphingomonas sp. SCN 67-18]